MQALAFLVRAIARLNALLGWILSFFALAIVLVCFAVVVLRYGFRTGAVPLQDLYVWLNGMMFMGLAGYTLLKDGHVRVDIFYREAATRTKAIVDMVGCVVFVAPFVTVLAVWAWPYVMRSWRILESSPNFGGLPGLYILKSFLLVFCAVVALQTLAIFLRGVLVLGGREDLLPEHLRYATYEPDPEQVA